MTREAENEPLRDMDITDNDVYAAMQRIPGYVDVSVGDCMTIYRFAQEHAKRRTLEQICADRLMRKCFVALTSSQRLHEAALLMAKQGLSHSPVVDEHNQVIGTLSERDILRIIGADSCLEYLAGVLHNPADFRHHRREIRVVEAMTTPAVTIPAKARFEEISNVFKVHGRRSLMVVDRGGRLKGLLDFEDFVVFCG